MAASDDGCLCNCFRRKRGGDVQTKLSAGESGGGAPETPWRDSRGRPPLSGRGASHDDAMEEIFSASEKVSTCYTWRKTLLLATRKCCLVLRPVFFVGKKKKATRR